VRSRPGGPSSRRIAPAAGFSLRWLVDADGAGLPVLFRHVKLIETNRRAGCRTAQFRAGPAQGSTT
jgi:hypothetical protein